MSKREPRVAPGADGAGRPFWGCVVDCGRRVYVEHHAFCRLCWDRMPHGHRRDVAREHREGVGKLYTYAVKAAVRAVERAGTEPDKRRHQAVS